MEDSSFNIDFQNTDLTSKIVQGLERISEAYRVLLWEHAKTIGLSPIQIQVLIFIYYHPSHLCSVSALAKEFNLTKPTISDAIKVMDKKGLVHKIPSLEDKRAYTIEVSEEGKKVVAQTEYFASPIREGVKALNKNEQAEVFSALSKVIYTLNKSNVISVQRMCHTCQHFSTEGQQLFCKLLELKLDAQDLRLDCPEHEARNV